MKSCKWPYSVQTETILASSIQDSCIQRFGEVIQTSWLRNYIHLRNLMIQDHHIGCENFDLEFS